MLITESKRRALGINEEESDGEYEAYLNSLTSYSLERLSKEPEILRQESSRITQSMEELAFNNYKAFILTSDCVTNTHRGVSVSPTKLVRIEF